jgi:hypothetical protein
MPPRFFELMESVLYIGKFFGEDVKGLLHRK